MKTETESKPELLKEEQWNDAALRHAYFPNNHRVAFCGYDGPSTWRNEGHVPSNACPICVAILPEYWDGQNWIKPTP